MHHILYQIWYKAMWLLYFSKIFLEIQLFTKIPTDCSAGIRDWVAFQPWMTTWVAIPKAKQDHAALYFFTKIYVSPSLSRVTLPLLTENAYVLNVLSDCQS